MPDDTKYGMQNLSTFAYKLESAEGTPATDDAADAVGINKGFALKTGRTAIDRDMITGGLDRLPHIIGGYGDIGFAVSAELKGSGTQGVKPEIGALLQTVFGGQALGVAGTVAASPSPTTSGLTVQGSPTLAAGDLIRVQVSATPTYEVTRIITAGTPGTTVAVTCWPPLSVAPASGYAVQVGSNYKLKSDAADFTSGTGVFYFSNGRKIVFAGGRGKVSLTYATGKPVAAAFDLDALSFAETVAALGYTPGINKTMNPPICLGMAVTFLFAATVTGTPSTTSVPLTATVPLDVLAAADQLIVDTASGATPNWETKTVATWTDATQTATCAALTTAPTAGHVAYIRRTMHIQSLKVDIAPKWEKAESMVAAYGVVGMVPTERTISVSFDEYYKSTLRQNLRDNVVSTELWALTGSTAGNMQALCIPRFVGKVADRKIADIIGLTNSGEAYLTSGNDAAFLSFL